MIVRIILAVLLVFLVPATTVFADTNVITINGVPEIVGGGGIVNFTMNYVDTTQIDFSWGYNGNVNRIMIRGKYGSYPTDKTDGWLVYYGNAVAASDTTVNLNFDEVTDINNDSDEPFTVFYTAWGQKVDDSWIVDTNTSKKESDNLIDLGIIVLVCFI